MGVALAAMREYMDITQEQLAKATGTSTSTISRYEDGHSAAHFATMVTIAEALGIPIEMLAYPSPDAASAKERLALYRSAQRADAGTS